MTADTTVTAMTLWQLIADHAGRIAAVGAGLAALGFIWRVVVRIIRWADRMGDILGRLHKIASYELQPNSGGSLADAVRRTETTQQRILVTLDDAVARLDTHARKIDEHVEESKEWVNTVRSIHPDVPEWPKP